MSVVGRLWRRAPAWRLWVFIALATTALAVMFPPHVPDSLWRHAAVPDGARYRSAAETPPPNETWIDTHAITGTRQTLIPFAGRQVPLPQGQWSEIALLHSAGPLPEQGLVLARLQSGRMTGLVVVLGTPATESDAPIPAAACVDPTGLPVHVLTPPDNRDLAVQECWSLRRLTTSDLADARHLLENRVFGQLGRLNVAVPTHLLVSHYFRHDDHAKLAVMIMLPDPTQSSGLMRRVDGWMRRWVPLLHRGFDDHLGPPDVTATLAHDPGFAPG